MYNFIPSFYEKESFDSFDEYLLKIMMREKEYYEPMELVREREKRNQPKEKLKGK